MPTLFAQHVDGAEGGYRLVDRGPAAVVGGQVRLQKDGGAAVRGDLLHPRRAGAGVAVGDQHVGSGGRRRVGDAAADAERAPGDHERLSRERERGLLHDRR